MKFTYAAMNEPEVRAMRDQVYGKPSTDNNWNACRENWLTPESIKWLVEQCSKLPKPSN